VAAQPEGRLKAPPRRRPAITAVIRREGGGCGGCVGEGSVALALSAGASAWALDRPGWLACLVWLHGPGWLSCGLVAHPDPSCLGKL